MENLTGPDDPPLFRWAFPPAPSFHGPGFSFRFSLHKKTLYLQGLPAYSAMMAAVSDRVRRANNSSTFRVLASLLHYPVWPEKIMIDRPRRHQGFGRVLRVARALEQGSFKTNTIATVSDD